MRKLLLVIIYIWVYFCSEILSQNLQDTLKINNKIFVLEFFEDFDKYNDNWSMGDWTFETNLCEFNPENVNFWNSKLQLILSKKKTFKGKYPNKPYWGAEYYTTKEFSYGRYIVKFKPVSIKGVISSFFLIHIDFDKNWTPTFWNEIDIEFVGATKKVQFNIWNKPKSQHPVIVELPFDAKNAFHIYTIDYLPDSIKFYIDDSLYYAYKNIGIHHTLSIRANLWISESIEWAGGFDEEYKLPSIAEYKWVKYYRLLNY